MSRLDGDVGVAKSAGPGSRGMVFGVVLEGWKDYTGTGSVGGQCVYAFCRSPVQCTAMCVPVSEAGDGEQWPEGDAVARGEVVSARLLDSPTKEYVPNSSAEPQTTSTLKTSAQTSPSQSTRPGEQGGRSPIRY
jgi:hypothetical protein